MRREITFDPETGAIVVTTDTEIDRIYSGAVYLTLEQCHEAATHGWLRGGDRPSETSPPLYVVRRRLFY